jgi:hypothetical protein
MKYAVSNLGAVISISYVLADKLQLASSLLQPTKGVFDGEPILFPVPDDAPSEIPRIILASKDGKFKCNISKQRIELLYVEDTATKELQELREQLLKVLGEIAKVMKSESSNSIYRLGFVVDFRFFHDAPIELIKVRYIKPGAIEFPRSLELNVLDRMDWDNLTVNRWYRISARTKKKNGEEGKEMSVIFDINTIPEKKYDFSVESLVAFYDRACGYVLGNIGTLL